MLTHRVVRCCFVTLLGVAALLLTACSSPLTSPTTGSLSLTIHSDFASARTIQSTLDMTITSYTISGSGPGDSSFTQAGVTDASFSKDSLVTGSWTIKVDALNANGVIIASSQSAVTIYEGQTTSATITVVPLSGNGTLSLSISWPANCLTGANVVASLTPTSGSASSFNFDIAGDGATYSGSWPAGYYSLSLKLMQGNALLVGREDAVRILAGQTSSASYTYSPGSVSITVDSDLQNPITITLSGNVSSIIQGQSMTVSASCSETPDTYQWYLNGSPISGATSSSVTVGSALSLGSYALDLVVTKDTRLSSLGVSFTVRPTETGFSTDFNDGIAHNWMPSSSQWSVINQTYQMTAANGGGAWRYSLYGQSFSFADFTYQVDVMAPVQGNTWPHSIYIRSWDGSPYMSSYVFSVCEQYGEYWVGTYINSSFSWTGWLSTSSLKTAVGATNTLKVVVTGSTMDFYINDVYVDTLSDGTLSSGFVGLAAGDGSTVSTAVFDNVSLTPTATGSATPPVRVEHKLIPLSPGAFPPEFHK